MKIKYMKFGDGPRTMVILPGISLRPVSETPQGIIKAYELFAQDFTVYLFDYKENPQEGTTAWDMAEDLSEAFEELELKQVYLYGVSLGGMVAQAFTIRYPQFVKKLVLASTVSKVSDLSKTEQWLYFAKEKDIISLVDSFMKAVYSKEVYDQAIDVMISMYKNLSDEDLRDFITRLKAVENFDVRSQLNQIKVPVMTFSSKADQVFSYDELKETSDILGCRSYFYDGYSHAIYDEAQDIKKRIYDFFMEEE